MPLSVIDGSLQVRGSLLCQVFEAPASSVSNNAIEALAGIEATKIVHQFPLRYSQPTGTAIVAFIDHIHIARASGTIVAIEAAITGTVTAGDYTATIDLKKSTSGGAFASVLSATIVLDSGNTTRVLEAGTINSSSYIDGDILQLTGAVAGASGSQSQGLCITVWLRENPE